jgi:hypothetical protein
MTSTIVRTLKTMPATIDQRSRTMTVSISDQNGSSFAYYDHELSDPGTVVPRKRNRLHASSTKTKLPAARAGQISDSHK